MPDIPILQNEKDVFHTIEPARMSPTQTFAKPALMVHKLVDIHHMNKTILYMITYILTVISGHQN